MGYCLDEFNHVPVTGESEYQPLLLSVEIQGELTAHVFVDTFSSGAFFSYLVSKCLSIIPKVGHKRAK